MEAELFKLKLKDFVKGLILAIITGLSTSIYQVIESSGDMNGISLKMVLTTSILAGLSYILKNWLTNSNDQFLKKE
jgi:hypothetical protein